MKKRSKNITRRTFVERTGVVAAGLAILPGSIMSGCRQKAPGNQVSATRSAPSLEQEIIAGTRMQVDWQKLISGYNIELQR